jgi:hypothetical protein
MKMFEESKASFFITTTVCNMNSFGSVTIEGLFFVEALIAVIAWFVK